MGGKQGGVAGGKGGGGRKEGRLWSSRWVVGGVLWRRRGLVAGGPLCFITTRGRAGGTQK